MKALLISIGLLLLSVTALQAQENSNPVPRKAIDITYIANEGFLISSRDSKVLIDGIFTEGFGRFQTPTAETLAKESQASPPFDNIISCSKHFAKCLFIIAGIIEIRYCADMFIAES